MIPRLSTFVDAVLGARRAWLRPAEFAEHAAISLQEAEDSLCELNVAGIVEVWDEPDGEPGIGVTFTPIGAEHLGLKLTMRGMKDGCRWVRKRALPSACPRPAVKELRESAAAIARDPAILKQRGGYIDQHTGEAIDQTPAPDVLVEVSEELHLALTARRKMLEKLGRSLTVDDIPPPIHIVDGTPYSEPEPRETGGNAFAPRNDCGFCGGRHHKRNGACPACCAWGWDDYFFESRRRELYDGRRLARSVRRSA